MTPTQLLLQNFNRTEESDDVDQHSVHYEPRSRDVAVILTTDNMFKLVETLSLSFNKKTGKQYVVFNCEDREDAISIRESVMDESDFAIFRRVQK